jgi:uncharacterized protein (DUF1015 family)
MAKVYPFRALRYAPSKVPIDKVVTQPYDKISPSMQDRYYALHPNNIIRIILGKPETADTSSNNVYTRAAATLKQWRESGILEKVPEPVVIVYFQRFHIPGTSEVRVRKGFVGTAQLEEYKNKVVFPHERTLTGPKKDRLELLRHTRTQFEQIFMLYEDPEQRIDRALEEVSQRKPDIEVLDEYGVTHTMWTVADRKLLEFIQQQMAEKRLIIADGHHRYETALTYRDERRAKAATPDPNASYERMPMTFFNMHAPGLTILPTHRVLSNLTSFASDHFIERVSEFFDMTSAAGNAEKLRGELRRMGETRITIGAVADRGERAVFLSLKPSLDLASIMPDLSEKQRLLDVVILHRLLIERCLGISEDSVKKESNITYVREMDSALNAVRTGNAQLAFLLNPTGLQQMRDVAYEGNVMPQKSTDFYPKVLSGLMMYSLED